MTTHPHHEERATSTPYEDPPSEALFRRLAGSEDLREQQDLVEEIVRLHLPATRMLAYRYRDRGIPSEDLLQVAALGLMKAVRGYDCDRGSSFMAYAAPTIVGELKRHFRDAGWAVRPARRLQELRPRITRATEDLSQGLGRAPTVRELAGHLETAIEDVVEALACGTGFTALSLDVPPDDDQASWADMVPEADATLDATPDRLALEALLAELPPRERRILAMRFFGDMTQTQIGEQIGVTQMHVSRLLSRALRRLREGLEEEETTPLPG